MALKTDWADARNILAIRLDGMGDVLMTSPALAAIRASIPAARLTLLTSGAGAETGRSLVIHPSASAASRRYPIGHYATAAQALQASTGLQIVFTGSDDETDLIAQAAARMERPPISLAGRLGLGELAALIAEAQVLLCNNTGPAHLAAALGTPVAVLYAFTNPQHTPWRVPARVLSHDVPCRNCLKSKCPQLHHDCLRRIPPEAVVEAVLSLLAGAAPLRPAPAPEAGAAYGHRPQRLTLVPCLAP